MKGLEFSSLPPLVQQMGGYEDVAIDQFGRELPICDLGQVTNQRPVIMSRDLY